ncbi:hypothetical protein [Aquimarina agarivorans]|uniref:hypothetical protein n=1 Tax=Aquimarina agarivorans TaxID=980584 RepID=UPI000248E613|nr:hypothetical protein [Aquimarina agarivorans]
MKTNILPLTPDELKIIRKEYDKGNRKFRKVYITGPILGVLALFTPPELWNFIKFFDKYKNIRKLEDVTEPMYLNLTMIVIILLANIIIIALYYFAFVYYLKKDLEEKEKISNEFKVIRVENLGQKIAENLEGLDTVLHFENNPTEIKKHLFNKSEKPELLNAKRIIIEQSKNSKIIFLEQIIE